MKQIIIFSSLILMQYSFSFAQGKSSMTRVNIIPLTISGKLSSVGNAPKEELPKYSEFKNALHNDATMIQARISGKNHKTLKQNFDKFQINVNPNPCSTNILIKNSLEDVSKEFRYYLFDVFGKELTSGLLNGKYTTVSLEKYSNGIYFLSCSYEGQLEVKKIVKISGE